MATAIGARLLNLIGGSKGRITTLPFASGWTSIRDLPAPEGQTFTQQWAARQKQGA